MKLSVFLQGRLVAHLFREHNQYLLQYEADKSAADFVSLTMPVQDSPWVWPRDLHPFFRQNLPEGYVLSVLREVLGSALDGTDLSLLSVVGRYGIGRVTVTPSQRAHERAPDEPLDLKTLLHEDFNPRYFDDLVRRYARSAVSGVVPKFLSPDAPHPRPIMERATLRTSRYIVKGASNFPYLALNEHYTMQVLARIKKVPTARTHLSDDGQVLLVERFDVDAEGRPTHGLEDACSLLGLPPHEKYVPSMERVLKATESYLPGEGRQAQLEQLGYHLLTNFVVRNADCHSKNIALYYTSWGDVAFTPVYDLVTTQAYDGFRDSTPGLSIEGRKTWTPGKTLPHFFSSRLGISRARYSQMLEQLCDSAVAVGHELSERGRSDPRWRVIIEDMLHAWDRGMQTVRLREPPLPVKRRSSPRVRKRKGEPRA